MTNEKKLKVCENGHSFYKSSDCPVCPICEQEKTPETGFLSKISAPARRALENIRITSLPQLAQYSEKEILALHGMGPKALTILKQELKNNGLTFK